MLPRAGSFGQRDGYGAPPQPVMAPPGGSILDKTVRGSSRARCNDIRRGEERIVCLSGRKGGRERGRFRARRWGGAAQSPCSQRVSYSAIDERAVAAQKAEHSVSHRGGVGWYPTRSNGLATGVDLSFFLSKRGWAVAAGYELRCAPGGGRVQRPALRATLAERTASTADVSIPTRTLPRPETPPDRWGCRRWRRRSATRPRAVRPWARPWAPASRAAAATGRCRCRPSGSAALAVPASCPAAAWARP
jgi:hypothetical protein